MYSQLYIVTFCHLRNSSQYGHVRDRNIYHQSTLWLNITVTVILFQPIVGHANPTIVEPLLNLLKTLHLEVQYEGKKFTVF